LETTAQGEQHELESERRNIAVTKVQSASHADPKDTRGTEDSSFALLRDNVEEVLRILMLRRWSFFVPFCLITTVAALASLRVARTYESTTVFERRDHPVLMNLHQTAATGSFKKFFRPTLAQDLTHPDAMCEVVKNLKLIDDLETDASGALTPESKKRCMQVGASLATGIEVKLSKKADHFDQIHVTHQSQNRNLPHRVVRQVRDVYIERTRRTLTAMLHDVANYFTRVAQQRRDKITRLEEELLSFQAKYIGVDPTDPGALRMKLVAWESERDALARTIETLQREIAARRLFIQESQATRQLQMRRAQQRGVPGTAAVRDPQEMALLDELEALKSEVYELKSKRRMTERHPDIVDRRERIARLQQRLAQLEQRDDADTVATQSNGSASFDPLSPLTLVWQTPLRSVQMEIQDRKSQLESARRRKETVQQQIADHTQLLDNVFAHRKEYMLKKDMIEQARTEYDQSMERVGMVNRILTADESERGISFTQLQPATASAKPIRPRSLNVVALSILAGVAGGAICVLLKELFDQRFRTTRQVARSLGLAILESVDEIVTPGDRARQLRRRLVYGPAVTVILLVGVGFACSSAYLNLENPAKYEELMVVPRQWWTRIAGVLPIDVDGSGGLTETVKKNAETAVNGATDTEVARAANNAGRQTMSQAL